MDPSNIFFLGLLGFMLVCSAFFSASETAFSSLNRIKLKNLVANGTRGEQKAASRALTLVENYDRLLSTVLIGNNIVNISASAIATVLLVNALGKIGVTAATIIMTVLVLVFGEISPKTLAKETPEKFAMFAARPLKFFMLILSPLNRFFSWWKKFILVLFHIKADHAVTEEELLTFVKEVRQEGGINKREEDMIRQAIEFDDMSAGDILTPRIDVRAVSLEDSPEKIEQIFFETGYSRLPVYTESIDKITGFILQKDFHYQVLKLHKSLESIIKPIFFTSRSMKVPLLLKTMQEKKSHIAVVVDEYGGTMGIVTVEDIVEELVGEIWDEHDKVVEQVTKTGDRSYRVLGSADLDELFGLFSISAEEKRWSTTVGGWVMEMSGGLPKEGAVFSYRGLTVTVAKIARHRVMEVVASASPETEA
ncbi:MAG: hemolysin family protein [Spirochaetaceae bacterium]|jgi:CBS domain containing-hemolysin-like protein|nr:hemolysin family protein [Spirochaetaceae bacterium]